MEKARIAKIIARAGYCSRRDAEKLILEGKVKLNGELVKSPALNVTINDDIVIEGKPLSKVSNERLWLFYKPVGTITTHKDPQGRQTVFDILPLSMPRVVSVGRLDLNTEGLLLLTNNGELARTFELPSNGLKRIYRCRVFGRVTPSIISALAKGVSVDGVNYGKIKATLEKEQTGNNTWVTLELTEGKNREIRNVFEHFGLRVNRLIRTHYGAYSLEGLKIGEVREVKVLRD
jgi:23S rRNA pseudouridine2605 synthase